MHAQTCEITSKYPGETSLLSSVNTISQTLVVYRIVSCNAKIIFTLVSNLAISVDQNLFSNGSS